MMIDIHKHRDTQDIYWKESTISDPHIFFFLEEKHERIDTCTVFSFCFDRDQLASVLQKTGKNILKLKKKSYQFCLLQTFVWLGGRFLLAFWD